MSDETTTETTADTTTEMTTEAPETKPADPPSWLDGLGDDDKALIEARGFKSPADALSALKASAPPETPDGYELPVPEGDDPAFSKAVAPIMHKAGLSAAQAKALAEGWNEMQAAERAKATEAAANAEKQAQALFKQQDADLKRDWGAKDAENRELARRATTLIEGGEKVQQSVIDAMEGSSNYTAVMKFFASVGRMMAEDTAHGINTQTSNPSPYPAAANFYDKSGMNP